MSQPANLMMPMIILKRLIVITSACAINHTMRGELLWWTFPPFTLHSLQAPLPLTSLLSAPQVCSNKQKKVPAMENEKLFNWALHSFPSPNPLGGLKYVFVKEFLLSPGYKSFRLALPSPRFFWKVRAGKAKRKNRVFCSFKRKKGFKLFFLLTRPESAIKNYLINFCFLPSFSLVLRQSRLKTLEVFLE